MQVFIENVQRVVEDEFDDFRDLFFCGFNLQDGTKNLLGGFPPKVFILIVAEGMKL